MLAGVLSLAGGCATDPSSGYSFASTYNESVQTVAVPIFENLTMFPGLESQLSEAVAKEIQRATPWRVAARASADTELTASVTAAEYRTLSTTRGTGLSEEQAFTITVRFNWRDSRTGETLVARRQFAASATTIQARPTGERVEVGHREAIEELARAIVRELRSDW
ncbi:MAG: hypothetical protein ACI89L_001779 [Phycisphaerales bacterium]|jgi:hypothetical protein